MKRSEINQIIREEIEFCRQMNFFLPPFAFWTPEQWKTKEHDYDEIRDNMLGWDVTDYSSGDYYNVGTLLFTIRNGNDKLDKYEKQYCEKLLIIGEGQVTPYHFHYSKMEDIINRGGGNLMMQVYNSTDDYQLADTAVEVSVDGHKVTVEAGTILGLAPGESITLPPYLYHQFWAEEEKVLSIEVSAVNDDTIDNHFLAEIARFPELIEDESSAYLLCSEYPPAPDCAEVAIDHV